MPELGPPRAQVRPFLLWLGGLSAGWLFVGCAIWRQRRKKPERLAAHGYAVIYGHRSGAKVGHSGHIGLTPVFDEVCPRKSLQHKEFDGLGTVGTLGTVDFYGVTMEQPTWYGKAAST